MFTDVDCGYCRRLHAEIDEYMEQGIEVRYLLYPRNGPCIAAWNTSEEVWCSAIAMRALTQCEAGSQLRNIECDASIVSDHYVLGRRSA